MQDTPDPSQDVPEDSAPVEKIPRPGNNLPLQLTSFVGHGREMAEAEALLSDHRLLTLTGPGGSGKTRLAHAVASGMVEGFEDGVWLVELASLSDPDLVAQAVASVLEVRETPGSSIAASLVQLGQLLLMHEGDLERVEGLRAEAETLRSEPLQPSQAAYLVMFTALASWYGRDDEQAFSLFDEGLSLFRNLGNLQGAAFCLGSMGFIVLARDDFARAGTIFEAAWAEGRAMSPEQAVEYALEESQQPEESQSPAAYPAGLSAREVEVLRLVARGMTNAQAARELYISPHTVNAHLGSVYHKIGSSTRAEAAHFASEHGLL